MSLVQSRLSNNTSEETSSTTKRRTYKRYKNFPSTSTSYNHKIVFSDIDQNDHHQFGLNNVNLDKSEPNRREGTCEINSAGLFKVDKRNLLFESFADENKQISVNHERSDHDQVNHEPVNQKMLIENLQNVENDKRESMVVDTLESLGHIQVENNATMERKMRQNYQNHQNTQNHQNHQNIFLKSSLTHEERSLSKISGEIKKLSLISQAAPSLVNSNSGRRNLSNSNSNDSNKSNSFSLFAKDNSTTSALSHAEKENIVFESLSACNNTEPNKNHNQKTKSDMQKTIPLHTNSFPINHEIKNNKTMNQSNQNFICPPTIAEVTIKRSKTTNNKFMSPRPTCTDSNLRGHNNNINRNQYNSNYTNTNVSANGTVKASVPQIPNTTPISPTERIKQNLKNFDNSLKTPKVTKNVSNPVGSPSLIKNKNPQNTQTQAAAHSNYSQAKITMLHKKVSEYNDLKTMPVDSLIKPSSPYFCGGVCLGM